jgi:hypothetical protein
MEAALMAWTGLSKMTRGEPPGMGLAFTTTKVVHAPVLPESKLWDRISSATGADSILTLSLG